MTTGFGVGVRHAFSQCALADDPRNKSHSKAGLPIEIVLLASLKISDAVRASQFVWWDTTYKLSLSIQVVTDDGFQFKGRVELWGRSKEEYRRGRTRVQRSEPLTCVGWNTI